MKRGADHAWNERWDRAVEEYTLALEQFPEDVSARTYLAMAAFRAGRLATALELYQGLWKAQPSNLVMLQRIAELQRATGDLESACTSFRVLAEIHVRRRSFKEAFSAWQKVVELKPRDPSFWGSLVDVATQLGTVAEVLPGYLKLARELALEGRFQEAIQVAERASTLDSANPAVMELLAAIRRALEYSWRAASVGDELPLDILPRLIPPLRSAGEPRLEPVPPEPAGPPEQQPEATLDGARAVDSSTEGPASFSEQALGSQREPPAAALPEFPLEAGSTAPGPEVISTPEPPAESESAAAVASSEARVAPKEEPIQPVAESEIPVSAEQPDGAVGEPVAPVDVAFEMEPPAVATSLEQPGDSEPVEAIGVQGGEVEEDACWIEQAEDVPSQASSSVHEEPEEAAAFQEMEKELSDREALVVQAREARKSGKLREAVALYGEALAAEPISVDVCVELAETYERLGESEQAAAAYGRALELAPHLPPALAGLARLHLAAGQLEAAEEKASLALEASAAADGGVDVATLELLLEVLRERESGGEVGLVVERLAWLRDRPWLEQLDPEAVDSLMQSCTDLLGQCAGEHLEEIALLPAADRAEAVLALRNAEDHLRQGKLRSAADEMYRLLAVHGDFLPAQSLLGRTLVLQGRAEEARERARRLARLYELRGAPWQALEVLWWMVAHRVGDEETRNRLAELLRAGNRLREAEMVELGWQEAPVPEPHPPLPLSNGGKETEQLRERAGKVGVGTVERGRRREDHEPEAIGSGDLGTEALAGDDLPVEASIPVEQVGSAEAPIPGDSNASSGASEGAAEQPALLAGQEAISLVGGGGDVGVVSAADAVLLLAEDRFSARDPAGAAALLRSALEEEWMVDASMRAAFSRVLKMLGFGDGGESPAPGLLKPRESADNKSSNG